MKALLRVAVLVTAIAALICFGASISSAQTAGDYQSAGSGNWNSPSTWQIWDGSAWVSAFDTPTTGKAVRILAPHAVTVTASITIDSVIVDTLSTLTINSGVTVTVIPNAQPGGGRLSAADSSVIVYGTYEHNLNGGSLPRANWGIGSTCLMTGLTSASPANGSQNYYNFTWNCRNETASLNPGFNNNTIRGNLNVLNTGVKGPTIWWMRLTSNANGMGTVTPNVITINGDVNVGGDSTAFTISGSSGAVHTVHVRVLGNLNVLPWTSVADTASFQLANGSGCQGNWYVSGNVTLLGKAVGTNSTAGTMSDTLIFCGTGVQTLTNGLKNKNLVNWKIAVYSNATLSMDGASTLGVATATEFRLKAGASFISGHANGLNGNISIPTAPVLDTTANYTFNGTVAQVTGALLAGPVNNLTINNASGVTTSAAVKVNGILALQAGVLEHTANPVTMDCARFVKTGGSANPAFPCGKTVPVIMASGWNLVSVPVSQTDYTAGTVFPGSFGDLFRYEAGSYVPTPSLMMGPCYWAYYSTGQTVDVTGSVVAPVTVSLAAGWNLVGSRDVSVDKSLLTTNPTGQIFGDLFAYSGGSYVPVTVLAPGGGVWMYVLATCTLTIP